ncbi:MAG TPA: aminodeoxychorismate synthase component I [Acidimicrobiia bacterium]|nr:aminodeoxychorismate synthase component I [Acidimicrobiia bacterium]
MSSLQIRFDDLRPLHRRGFALTDIERILVATRLDEVRTVLAEAESQVAVGKWVGGWISYEAAPAFDPVLQVIDPTATAFEGLPLVWLAVSRRRHHPNPATASGDHRLGEWESLTSEEEHRDALATIRRRIEAGDTYQVNHTFLLQAEFAGDPAAFYQRLVRSQSCGYGALIDTGDWVVASASPELFFEWKHGSLVCRPMKGTVRRGRDADEDAHLRAWLEASEKNRAENVMIVDMVRNDLGRIAQVGSVEVPALFTSEKYDTVWQLTSTVTARPRPGTGLVDVFDALFPSASITGAPKVSTMRIISELEAHPRGVYCGAIGFGGPGPEGPEWAFNVGIRTVLLDRRTGRAYYGTGGGITYDSEPADEYAEAKLKAEVLRRTRGELKLLESTRWDPNLGARHLDRHLQRAADSAGYFDIPFDPAEVRAAIERAVKGLTDPARLRILVDREGWVSVEATEITPCPSPVRLTLDDRPIDVDSPFLYHKTTIRDVYAEAAARHPHADDVVMWNDAGQLTETTIGNLAVEIDGEWLTPPVSSGLLAGTERAARLAAGELAERVLTLADLHRAEAIARLNSVRGWEECVLLPPAGAVV